MFSIFNSIYTILAHEKTLEIISSTPILGAVVLLGGVGLYYCNLLPIHEAEDLRLPEIEMDNKMPLTLNPEIFEEGLENPGFWELIAEVLREIFLSIWNYFTEFSSISARDLACGDPELLAMIEFFQFLRDVF